MRWPLAWRSSLDTALAEIERLKQRVLKTEARHDEVETKRRRLANQLAEYAGQPTIPDLLEAHDVHRKALADALGEQKRHLNWEQLITLVAQLNKSAYAWMADYEAQKQRADALEKDPSRSEGSRLQRRIAHLERQLDDATKGGDQGTPIRKSWGLK